MRRPNLRQTTRESYDSLIDTHIVPALGLIHLDDLRTTHLQQLYAAKLKDGSRADGRPGGLSVTTVHYMHAIPHRALKHALKWGCRFVPWTVCHSCRRLPVSGSRPRSSTMAQLRSSRRRMWLFI